LQWTLWITLKIRIGVAGLAGFEGILFERGRIIVKHAPGFLLCVAVHVLFAALIVAFDFY